MSIFDIIPTYECAVCQETFPPRTQLNKHLKKFGHRRPNVNRPHAGGPAHDDIRIKIRGAANAPTKNHYDEDVVEEAKDPSPCVVCGKNFSTKHGFFSHLYCGRHYRGAEFVRKRRAEMDTGFEAEGLQKTARP